jgi:diacylglycerol kinase family enzyme
MRVPSARPAVVANPSKAADPAMNRREVIDAMVAAGLPTPSRFETTEEDPGRGQTTRAVEEGADLVVACGGDGTVRACAAVLAGSNVSSGLSMPTCIAPGARNISQWTDGRIIMGARSAAKAR